MCPRTSVPGNSTPAPGPAAPKPVAAAIFAVLACTGARAEATRTEQALDPIVVTAQRLHARPATDPGLTPGAITVLDGLDLQQRSVTQLADLLRYVPGLWAESQAGNDDVFYSSRGSNLDATDYDKNGVKFFQDGLPVTAADGNNHNRALDPLNARRVTVAHGANALAYGASTLGGAIDFTTPTARNSAPMSVSLSGGSFGQRGARGTLGGTSGALDGLLSVEAQQRDGYRGHSRLERHNVYANAGWQPTEAIATRFYFTLSDYFAELPRELTPAQYAADPRQARPDAIAGNHSKDVQAWRLAFKTTVDGVAGGTLELGASHEQQSLYHPIVSSPFFSLLIDTDHKDSGAMLRWRRNLGAHELQFGANHGFSKVSGGNYENDAGQRGGLMWTSDDSASTLELFALDHWQFAPRWTLVYGAQFVSAERQAGGFDAPAYSAFNPRLGLLFGSSEASQWYASLSRTYEPPTTYQLTDGTTGTLTALEAMHGVVVETGLRGSAQHGSTRLQWDVSGYYTSLRDEILSRNVDDLSAPANFDTTHAGVESLFGASFALGHGGHRIEPLVSATFNAFAFDSDTYYGNNRLPSAPRWFVRGELMYAHTSGLRIGPAFDFIGPRYVDFANTWRVGSYGLLGARASFARGNWEAYAEGRNLLNRRYVATVAVKDEAGAGLEMLHPGAPRAVYFGARYQF
ncbi:MAG: TonB-dependent receptor [Pseudomonadota bacterium]|nr:TonB-dependent receptor [Pseudomonadota bacterium]